jgi:hypothetical protein
MNKKLKVDYSVVVKGVLFHIYRRMEVFYKMLLSAHVNAPLTSVVANVFNRALILAYIPGTIMNNVTIMINTLKAAVASFLVLDRHLPFQLRWNQKSTVTPQVNHDSKSAAEMLRRELKTGIALARIQTTTQNRVTEKIQTTHSVLLPTSPIAMEARRPRDDPEALDEASALKLPFFLAWRVPIARRKKTCK